jgi:hypothetical protein
MWIVYVSQNGCAAVVCSYSFAQGQLGGTIDTAFASGERRQFEAPCLCFNTSITGVVEHYRSPIAPRRRETTAATTTTTTTRIMCVPPPQPSSPPPGDFPPPAILPGAFPPPDNPLQVGNGRSCRPCKTLRTQPITTTTTLFVRVVSNNEPSPPPPQRQRQQQRQDQQPTTTAAADQFIVAKANPGSKSGHSKCLPCASRQSFNIAG